MAIEAEDAREKGRARFDLPLPLRPIRKRLRVERKRLGAAIDRLLPKRLFPRSLLIIVLPMVLLQSVVTLVFMERHWNAVTQKLSEAVVRDIAAVIDVIDSFPEAAETGAIERIAAQRLELNVALLPSEPLPPPARKPFFGPLDSSLATAIARDIGLPFWIDTVNDSGVVRIIIKMEEGNLRVFAPRNHAYASNSHIFLVWMIGTAVVLLGVAILFLRGQVRPIQLLADAAESFGRGQPTPPGFRPRGATEVRRAGLAFIQMRQRIERQIEQRTAMLTGVSHDLRTILTRFRLQLATATPRELDPELGEELRADLDEMQSMVEAYMNFARGEAEEDIGVLDLAELFERCAADVRLRGCAIETRLDTDPIAAVRPVAFSRMVTNLVTNASRHAHTVALHARREGNNLFVVVDDDGPGIPEAMREDAFRPFVRLDENSQEDLARNQNVGGTGLGLSIARDIARSHGGDVTLGDSPMGGLRAKVRVPS